MRGVAEVDLVGVRRGPALAQTAGEVASHAGTDEGGGLTGDRSVENGELAGDRQVVEVVLGEVGDGDVGLGVGEFCGEPGHR